MVRSLFKQFLLLFAILVISIGITACQKFEGDQEIPAYIRIERFQLTTDYSLEGSNTHNISEVWVYVDDQLIGAFEMPATVPVLAKGNHKLELRPGIKLNGIAATRAYYPFYKPYQIADFFFVEDSVQTIEPTTSYHNTITFAWIEDFEYASISLEKTGKSDTTVIKTSPIDSPEALLSDYSSYSGVVYLDEEASFFQIASSEAFSLPGKGTPVFLELDYKCDQRMGIGLFAHIGPTIIDLPLVGVNPNTQWNKIYINLSPIVTDYSDAEKFKIYFEADRSEETTARFYLDNIKLIHRNI